MFRVFFRAGLFWSGLFLAVPGVHLAWAYSMGECVECHAEGRGGSALHLAVEEFEASVHGRGSVTCQDCHQGVKDDSHQHATGSGAVDCGQCHQQVNRHGSKTASDNRPQCWSCHTSHRILEKDDTSSSVHPNNLRETCRACHPVESGGADYLTWLPSVRIKSHPKQDFSGTYDRADCLGCHQGTAAHGESGNINGRTCYKCHLTPEGRGALLGYIHPRADLREQPATYAAAIVYQLSLAVLCWFGFRFLIHRFTARSRNGR